MALKPGTRLGSFEILDPLGAGGMGEVYRARDTRLGRDVAIKVLPESFAQDPSRTARFEREARLLAAINHPAIGAIYGAEEFGSVRCIIMELVPGETLAERILRGPMPLEEACDLSRQIAEALEAAHERGVIHRDLKPSNIKVTPDGKVKVLDLGLAKAMEKPSPDPGMSDSPTAPREPTETGAILGTAGFMSPEQARGRPVDKRTDIWAFGCVFYEMLSGRRAFTGESISDVLVSILTKDPDWAAIPSSTPARVRELLSRCLQKDPNKRLRDIGDARLEIERTMARPGEDSARDTLPPRRRAFLLYGTLALLLAVGAWLGVRVARPTLPDKKYLAIFLKDLSGAANGQLIADGFAETVSARVGQDPRIQVVSSSAATEAREKATDPYEAARRLHANLLVRGTFQQEGENVRFTFFVENAEDRQQLLSDQIRGRKGDLFAVQDEVAEKVARCLGVAQLPPASITGLRGLSQQDLYLEALGLLQRYDNTESVDQATRILQSLVGQGARSALVHSALARAHLYKYDLTKLKTWSDQAIAECERAREINGNLPEVHVTLGEVRNRTGDAQTALTEFEKALLLQPDYAAAMIGRGDAEKALGRMAQAEDSYQRAIHLQPGNWTAYNNLGRLYMLQARYEKAAEAFSRVTEVSPDNSRAFFNLGAAFYYLQRPDEARAAFEQSIRLVPSGFAYSNLGTLEFSVGNYTAAAKAFEEAVKQSPSDYQLWFNLGDAYRWSPRQRERAAPAYERAIELGLQALKVNPRDAATHAMLARCFAKLGKPVEARREIERAIELEPKSAEILYKAAVTAAVAGRKHEALGWIARAVDAGYPTALIMLEPEFASLRGEPDFLKAVTPKSADRSS